MNTEIHRGTPRDDEGRDWSYAAASQGMPTIASVLPDVRNGQGRSPLKVLGRAQPCQHLDFGLLSSRTVDNKCLCLKPPSFWYVAVAGNKETNLMGLEMEFRKTEHFI